MSWLDRAACRHADPDWFFPTDDAMRSAAAQQALRRARLLCAACPVSAECLEWALESGQTHGIWAGTTPQARRALRHRRPGPRARAAGDGGPLVEPPDPLTVGDIA